MESATQQDQTALDEKVVESPELEAALQDWHRADGARKEAAKKTKTMREVVDDQLAPLALEVGDVVRCGGFRITKQRTEEKDVAFTRGGNAQVRIKALPIEE